MTDKASRAFLVIVLTVCGAGFLLDHRFGGAGVVAMIAIGVWAYWKL